MRAPTPVASGGGGRARESVGALPAGPGVYRFRDPAGRVMYVGRATSLRSRVGSYWGGLADRPHLRRMVAGVSGIDALVCASTHEAAWLERNLLQRSLPRWNRVRGGTETPTWVVVDDTVSTPGVVATPAARPEAFGPYLGYEQTSLVVRGLRRAWPLHLTGTRLTSVQRDLADAVGADPSLRDVWARAVRDVLRGDPVAVGRTVEALTAARDEAARASGFETAQAIQEELAAVAWLVQPQRVTGCTPADLVVAGWADDVLVRLRAHEGRLDEWTVLVTDWDHAQRVVEATPQPWREFARENALLQAALLRG